MTLSAVPGLPAPGLSRNFSHRRTRAQLRHDRALTANLYLMGRSIANIASEIGVSDSTIRRDLRLIMEYWRRSAIYDFNARKMRELAALEMTEAEAWSAWRRSCEPKVKHSRKVRKVTDTDDDGKTVTEAESTEYQVGDPRFLAVIHKCIETRLKVIGALTPSGDTNESITTGSPQPTVKSITVKRSVTVETTEVIEPDQPVSEIIEQSPREPNF